MRKTRFFYAFAVVCRDPTGSLYDQGGERQSRLDSVHHDHDAVGEAFSI